MNIEKGGHWVQDREKVLSNIDGEFGSCLSSNSIINTCMSRIVLVARDCGYAFLFGSAVLRPVAPASPPASRPALVNT